MVTLGRDWWTDPDAGHGLLLAPLAVLLAWRKGLVYPSITPREPRTAGQAWVGVAILIGAVLLRYLSGLAAELFTMRLSMLGAAAGLIVFYAGLRQLRHWWLPSILLLLSIPIPDVLLNSLALPLQLQASRIGAWLLESRHVPVSLAGNILQIPGQTFFVTEACSGLRSLTALIALGVLIGGLWLRTPWARIAIVAAAIPFAIAINGVRVFLTGFLAYFVSPSLAEGMMHYTEGWVLFVIAFAALGALGLSLRFLERPTRHVAEKET